MRQHNKRRAKFNGERDNTVVSWNSRLVEGPVKSDEPSFASPQDGVAVKEVRHSAGDLTLSRCLGTVLITVHNFQFEIHK